MQLSQNTNNIMASDTANKLAKISEVFSDGYHFVQLRAHCEHWQAEADCGNVVAQEFMQVLNTMHKLCLYIEAKG